MNIYEEIQKYTKENYGYEAKTCWIAHVKEMCGLPVKQAHNRISDVRSNPCPDNKIESIKEAFKYFRMI